MFALIALKDVKFMPRRRKAVAFKIYSMGLRSSLDYSFHPAFHQRSLQRLALDEPLHCMSIS